MKREILIISSLLILFSSVDIFANEINKGGKNDFIIKDTGFLDPDLQNLIDEKREQKMQELINKYRSVQGNIYNDKNGKDGTLNSLPGDRSLDLMSTNMNKIPKSLLERYKDRAECMWNTENRNKSKADPLQSKFNIVTSKSIVSQKQWIDYVNSKSKEGSEKRINATRIVNGCFEATTLVAHPINPDFCIGTGFHESAWGTSNIYKKKGNAFGWKAYNDTPYDSAQRFGSDTEGAKAFMEGIWGNKLSPDGTYHSPELGTTMIQVSLSYAFNNKGQGLCGGGMPSDTWSNSIAGVIRSAAAHSKVDIPKFELDKKE